MPPTPMLAIALPSAELLLILVFAASLPVTFFFWIRRWLSQEKEQDPENVVREQEKADEAHIHHHSGHGHSHSHAHGH